MRAHQPTRQRQECQTFLLPKNVYNLRPSRARHHRHTVQLSERDYDSFFAVRCGDGHGGIIPQWQILRNISVPSQSTKMGSEIVSGEPPRGLERFELLERFERDPTGLERDRLGDKHGRDTACIEEFSKDSKRPDHRG